ncbi:MAG TPA: Clp protease N-terminal domain-containing protein [Gemmataceae bacterium]|jgi:hypothetical protein
MYEGFSGQARKAIQLAHREAARLGHDYLGTEHLLLGIAREGSSGVVKLFAAYNTDPEKIYRHIETSLSRGAGLVSWDKLPFTPGALRALEHARQAASELNHSCVGVEHLLLGAVWEPDSSAAQLLLPLGFTPQLLQKELADLPEPENRDWMLRPKPTVGQPALRDPSAGDLESVVSAAPLPPTDAPPVGGGISGGQEGRISTADIQWTSVVQSQLEALQILVCVLGGALIGNAALGCFGAVLGGVVGSLVGSTLAAVKSNFLARAVGLVAGIVWGLLYGMGEPIVAEHFALTFPGKFGDTSQPSGDATLAMRLALTLLLALVGGGFGLIVGWCLGDWRKLMGPPSQPPKTVSKESMETFTEKT